MQRKLPLVVVTSPAGPLALSAAARILLVRAASMAGLPVLLHAKRPQPNGWGRNCSRRLLSRLTASRAGTPIRALMDRRRLAPLRTDDRTAGRTRSLTQARVETHAEPPSWWRTGIVRPPTGPAQGAN